MPHTTFRAMGCQIQIIVEADTLAARRALAEVPAWFEAWEQALSRFRADSELSRLNAAAQEAPVAVSAVLWEVLAAARTAAQASGGLVTPTLLTALEAAGYDRSFDTLPAQQPSQPAMPAPAFTLDESVVVDEPAHTVRLLHGVRLDFGGVAKGWAADQAAQRLGAYGPALVDAGGDIAVSGPRPNDEPWEISVASPLAPEDDLAQLWVTTGGVATSGRDYRRWQQGGVWQHHLLDPRTGRPAETDVLSATVLAPSAAEAEVAAKTALLLGSAAGLAWLAERPDLTGILVLEDGRVLHTLPPDPEPANDDLRLLIAGAALD